MTTLLAYLLFPIGGALLVVSDARRRERQLSELLLFGPLVVALAMGACTLAGVRCTALSVATVVIAAATLRLALSAWLRRRRGAAMDRGAPDPEARGGGAAAILLALASAGLAAAVAAPIPATLSDAVYIWEPAASQYAAEGRLDPALLRAVPEIEHRDYPPLFPASLAWLALARGGFDPWIGKPLGALFLAGLLLELCALARAAGLRRGAWIAAAAVGLVPALLHAATNGLADVIVTAYLAGALASLTERAAAVDARARTASSLRAGLFLAGAALAKHEGMVTGLVIVAIAVVLPAARGLRLRGRDLLLALAPMACVSAAWWSALARAGIANDLVAAAGHVPASRALARLGPLLASFGREALRPAVVDSRVPGFGLLPFVLAAAAIAVAWRAIRTRRVTFEQAVAPVQLAVYSGVLLFTPHDFGWHVDNALSRLLTQCLPAALLFALAAFAPEEGQLTERERVSPGARAPSPPAPPA